MSDQLTLDREYVDVREFDETADEVTGFDEGWLKQARQQLRAIEGLPAGWDSHGAGRPNAAIVNSGFMLLRSIAQVEGVPKPHINPTRAGGVQFEWESGPRYFEVELVDPFTAQTYFEDGEAHEAVKGTIHNRDSLEGVIAYIRRVAVTA